MKHYHPIQNREINKQVTLTERPMFPTWVCESNQCEPSGERFRYPYPREGEPASTE